MSSELQVFTTGHSSYPLGSFIWLLRKHGIEALVDVRRFPGTRKHPHFSRDNLAVALADEDMEYHWLEALGGKLPWWVGPRWPEPLAALVEQHSRPYCTGIG